MAEYPLPKDKGKAPAKVGATPASDAKTDAAADLIAALDAKDPKAVGLAFQRLKEACEEAYDEEG